MNAPVSPPSTPLLFLEFLTGPDRHLQGLHWHAAATDPAGLLPWLSDPALAGLCKVLPSFAAPSLVSDDPALAQALQRSGLQPTPEGLARCNAGQPWPTVAPWVAGDWYNTPPAKANAAQAASRQRALTLLQLVSSDADTAELEEAFRLDATLSYQLLRLVNSASMGSRREITSFGQAIAMLGRQQLKRWLNLLLFAARDDDERSALLMAHVSLRGRGMELWAEALGHDRTLQDEAFMAGMFSMLGVLFGMDLPDILDNILVSDSLRAALLHRLGPIGALLDLWEAAERQDADALRTCLNGLGAQATTHNALLLQACAWVLPLTRRSGPGN